MSERDPLDGDLLDRYLANDCSPAEQSAVEAWIAASPERGERVAQLRRVATGLTPLAPLADGEEMLRRVWAAAAAEVRDDMPPAGVGALAPSPRRTLRVGPGMSRARRGWRVPTLLVGAAVLAIAAVVVPRAFRPEPAGAPRTYATTRGMQAEFSLGDGTRVYLAADSRLTVPAGYGETTRQLTLDGEAMFTVTHRSAHPFVILTNDITTRVLGTTFGVRKYADDHVVQVAVHDGRVAVNGMVLGAGDVGQVDVARHQNVVRRDTDPDAVLSWTKRMLVFHDTPLHDVAIQLSRWYGVDVVVRDRAVGDMLLTATVRTTDVVDSVMKVVGITTGTTVERHGQQIIISRSTLSTPISRRVQ